jgi:tetratricopeptide (TPR) repeat protein
MDRRALRAGCWLMLCLWLGSQAGCNLLWLRHRTTSAQTAEEIAQAQQISEQAQTALDRGDYETARAELLQLVERDPDSAEARQRLGTVLQLENRLPEAEASFHSALARDHDYVEALIGLGQVEAQLGHPETALKRFEIAIELDPSRPRAHYSLGRLLEDAGKTDQALAEYFRALDLNPNDSVVCKRVAAIQLARHQPDQALTRLDQVVELSPDDGDARDLRGSAYLSIRRFPEAIEDFRAAANKLPDRPDVFLHLAMALEAAKKPADALHAAKRALALAPNDPATLAISERLSRH